MRPKTCYITFVIKQIDQMITITENQNQFVTETIEDMVEYICQEMADSGEIISGETVYKIIECFAIAKQAEFNGDFN